MMARNVVWDVERVSRLQADAREWSVERLLAWAFDTFGDRLTLASSFGLEDVALMHMASGAYAPVDVSALDTGLLFAETTDLMDVYEREYPINLRRILPLRTVAQQAVEEGDRLWERDPNRCCALRKIEPLGRALNGYGAWISGIRRDQAPTRAHAEPLEWDGRFGMVKLNPLAFWTVDQVWEYVRREEVPYNRLHDQGYPSIGCAPCTRAVSPGEDPRAGRWAGFDKTECGLHPAEA
jgi:phosphoadenosine phosphosulfate reductase